MFVQIIISNAINVPQRLVKELCFPLSVFLSNHPPPLHLLQQSLQTYVILLLLLLMLTIPGERTDTWSIAYLTKTPGARTIFEEALSFKQCHFVPRLKHVHYIPPPAPTSHLTTQELSELKNK